MKIAAKSLPVGALPYDNIKHATAMMAKLFCNMPFVALLPNMSEFENIKYRSFENIPGIHYKGNKLVLRVGTEKYNEGILHLDRTFNSPKLDSLEKYAFKAEFLERYLQMIDKFKSPHACINILGPFTVSHIILDSVKEQILADKSYRKLFVEAVCVKALWMIEKIKQVSAGTVPIVILEEPLLGQLGNLKRENEDVTSELVTGMIAKVVEKIKSAGAVVGIQCFDKCDWSVPIKAGVDLISFDAYNNPNNFGIIPEIVTDFLRGGGMVNWGIVPVVSDDMVKNLTLEYLYKRFTVTLGEITTTGIPIDLLYRASLVSLNGGTDKLSVMFAEKALMLSTQLGLRITANS